MLPPGPAGAALPPGLGGAGDAAFAEVEPGRGGA